MSETDDDAPEYLSGAALSEGERQRRRELLKVAGHLRSRAQKPRSTGGTTSTEEMQREDRER
jgi:hypothetical protein